MTSFWVTQMAAACDPEDGFRWPDLIPADRNLVAANIELVDEDNRESRLRYPS